MMIRNNLPQLPDWADDLDIEAEVKLIQEKKSRLSASQRKEVIDAWEWIKEMEKKGLVEGPKIKEEEPIKEEPDGEL